MWGTANAFANRAIHWHVAADGACRPAADVLCDAVVGCLENRRWRLREEDIGVATRSVQNRTQAERLLKSGSLTNRVLSEVLDTGLRAHLVLIPGSARDAARTYNDPVAQKGKASLPGDQDATRRRNDPDQGGIVFRLRHIAAGATNYYGGDRLPLACEHTCQNGILHSLKGEQTSACIADSDTDPDIQLSRLCQSTVHDPLGIFQR
ncbi:MAG TPA: hypothetical protein VMQ99_05940 [Acetobacteraceae bacterium]|jgi:hypothetical protein|nr:hypothetical protein [Acetobacteraceae bacterium]